MINELRKLTPVQVFLWVALVLALAGSLRHVADTFTSIDNNEGWGWVQAVAVDIGLFALALAIMQRRRIGRRAIWLVLGVVLFSAISIYANLAYGLTFTLGETPAWVQATKPWILAATLPILVLYLAEIVGSDMSYAVNEAEKEKRKAERQAGKQVTPKPSTAVQTSDTPDKRRRQMVGILGKQPDIGVSGLAEVLNTSRTTVYKDLDTLVANGDIKKNGQGYTVVKADART